MFDEQSVTCLSVVENQFGQGASNMCLTKGKCKHTIGCVLRAPGDFGLLGDVIAQVDKEESIIALVKEVACRRRGRTLLRTTPLKSKTSNGKVEKFHQFIEGLSRTLKDHIEFNYNVFLTSRCILLPWIVRHAGFTYTLFMIQQNGRTPFHNSQGAVYSAHMVSSTTICVLEFGVGEAQHPMNTWY